MKMNFTWVVIHGLEKEESVSLHGLEIVDYIKKLELSEVGSITVSKDFGKKKWKWWNVLFGLPHLNDFEILFHLDWSRGFSRLTFSDKKNSEYRALSGTRILSPEEIRLFLSAGEPTPCPDEEVLDQSIAFQAAMEFLKTGQMPGWLQYVFIR